MNRPNGGAFADAMVLFRANARRYQFELNQEALEDEMRRDNVVTLDDMRIERELREPKT